MIGWENGASFLHQSQNEVKQNQSYPWIKESIAGNLVLTTELKT